MKESTIKKINKTVVNYLSLVGLMEGKELPQNNPIVIYFMNNLLMSSINPFATTNSQNVSVIKLPEDQMVTMKIPTFFFHLLIKEFYNIYNKLDEIKSNQNQQIKELLISFIGNEYEYNKYIDDIMIQYKNSFYDLIRYYNSDNSEYIDIKIKLLTDKMNEFAELEKYEDAAILRDKIIEIKKGKI